MSESRIRSPKASERQKKELVKYFEDNPQALRTLNGSNNRAKQKIWIELAHKLNSLEGALKTTSKWSKYWNDIIMYTKTRAKTFISGESRCDRPPSEIEQRLLPLIGHLSTLKAWQLIWDSGVPKTPIETIDFSNDLEIDDSDSLQNRNSIDEDLEGNEYEPTGIDQAHGSGKSDMKASTFNKSRAGNGENNYVRQHKHFITSATSDISNDEITMDKDASSSENFKDISLELAENIKTIGNSFNTIGVALHNIASILEKISSK